MVPIYLKKFIYAIETYMISYTGLTTWKYNMNNKDKSMNIDIDKL